MRKALLPAFLLVLGSVVLGATVLREPLARAATPFTNVIVGNTSASPVPVTQQGTADVNVTNTSLKVASPDAVTGGGFGQLPIAASPGGTTDTLGYTAVASAVSIHLDPGVDSVILGSAAVFLGPNAGGNSTIVLSFYRPLSFDVIKCFGGSGSCSVSWAGN